jgi:hypothetical protein
MAVGFAMQNEGIVDLDGPREEKVNERSVGSTQPLRGSMPPTATTLHARHALVAHCQAPCLSSTTVLPSRNARPLT